MANGNRIKETTISTDTAALVLGGAAVGFRGFMAALGAGAAGIEIMVGPDSAGAWLMGLYSLTDAQTLTRTAILDSSAGGAHVTLAAGVKEIYNTVSAQRLAGFSGTRDLPFASAVPLDFVGQTYMPRTKVSAGLTLSAAAGAVRNALVYMRLLGDGATVPTFSGMLQWGSSQDFDIRNNIENQVQVFSDGTSVFYSITQAVSAQSVAVSATAVTLNGPSSGIVNTASTAFTVGTDGARASAVTVTPTPVTGVTFSPASVTLPAGSGTATFTATSTTTGAKSIALTNSAGLANPAVITYTVAAAATAPDAPTIGAATAPDAPTIGAATAGDGAASVAFTAPANNGGSAILDNTVTATPGGATATGTTSPIIVSGLTNGTAYTFTVKSRNSVGSSAASAASNSVTPAAAVVLRYGSLVRVAESPTAPYTYTGSGASAGFGSSEGDGVLNVAFKPSVDGRHIVKLLTTPAPYGSGTYTNELLIGVDVSNTSGKHYADIDYAVAGHGDSFAAFSNGNGVGNVGIGAAANDQYLIERTNSSGTAGNTATLKIYVSKDGGASFSTVIGSWAGVPNGVLYIHMLVCGVGSWTPVSQSGLA